MQVKDLRIKIILKLLKMQTFLLGDIFQSNDLVSFSVCLKFMSTVFFMNKEVIKHNIQ